MATITLSPILTTARDMLREVGAPLHVNEIAEGAVNANENLGMTADVFAKKLASALARHLKLKTQTPIFAKVQNKNGSYKRGIYRLKQERSRPAAANVEPPSVSGAFIGRAGEYAVMSELLFWGYNVSLMSVDSGVDIVACKDNQYFNMQVKTASAQDGGRFLFTIKKSSFDANDKASTFYVFVMRKKLTCDFAILPSNHVKNLLLAGAIGASPTMSITITADVKGRRFVLNGNTDLNIFINQFGIIR